MRVIPKHGRRYRAYGRYDFVSVRKVQPLSSANIFKAASSLLPPSAFHRLLLSRIHFACLTMSSTAPNAPFHEVFGYWSAFGSFLVAFASLVYVALQFHTHNRSTRTRSSSVNQELSSVASASQSIAALRSRIEKIEERIEKLQTQERVTKLEAEIGTLRTENNALHQALSQSRAA